MQFVFFDVDHRQEPIQQMCLDYISHVDWGAAKKLHQVIVDGVFHEVFGASARLYFLFDLQDGVAEVEALDSHAQCYVLTNGEIVGFGAIVENDYISIPDVSPWISSIWVDPQHRGKHLSREIVGFLEGMIRDQGKQKVYILTQHQGLYERYGYSFIQEMPEPMHDRDYLYAKDL